MPGRSVRLRAGGRRSARARAPALQPAAVRRGGRAAEQARLTPARADSADLDRRARLSRAVSRERRVRRSDQRARAAAPARSRAVRRRASAPSTSSASARRCSSTARSAPRPTVFDSVLLEPTTLLTGDARERVLDWWASALDREARPRPEIERQARLSADPRRGWRRARAASGAAAPRRTGWRPRRAARAISGRVGRGAGRLGARAARRRPRRGAARRSRSPRRCARSSPIAPARSRSRQTRCGAVGAVQGELAAESRIG